MKAVDQLFQISGNSIEAPLKTQDPIHFEKAIRSHASLVPTRPALKLFQSSVSLELLICEYHL